MLSSISVLGHKEDWSSELVYTNLLNVLSSMKVTGFKRMQLILCVPYYLQSKPQTYELSPMHLNSESHDQLIFEMFNFIKQHLPVGDDGKPAIVIDMFSTYACPIIKDQRARSVSMMFNRLNETIENLEPEKVHSVVLINHKDYENLNFKEMISSFTNVIFY